MNQRLITIQTVKDKTGYRSSASIYTKIAENKFPRPIKLNDGSGSNRWLETEIDGWISEQVEVHRGVST
jgi:predicted DNA-binding transcriptional regulator AlpA